MMNVIDSNEIYQQNTRDHTNSSTFDHEPLSSIFDNCNKDLGNNMNNMNCSMNNNMNRSMNNNMHNGLNNTMNGLDATNCGRTALGSTTDKSKLLLNHIRGRNNRDFKELVANFWMQPQNNNSSFQPSQTQSSQVLKNTMSHSSLSGTDPFGNFHPIELSSTITKNNSIMNGKSNVTMDMRIALRKPSNAGPIFSANNLGIDKNAFRSSSPSQRYNASNLVSSSNAMDNNMIPPMTQSSSNFNTSRRVSMCSSSVISDDSNHSHNSHHPVKHSATSLINAATNIVNGNEFDHVCYNNGMNNNINVDPITSNRNLMDGSLNINNVVSEPGPYDIVCGRNSGAYNYIGNRRFRVTIEMNLQRYIDSPTREDKTNVIKSIVWMLHEQVGARFLKKETSKKSSGGGSRRRGTPRYTIMTDKQAREKVGHALRDLVITARKEQQQGNKQQQEQGSNDLSKQECNK